MTVYDTAADVDDANAFASAGVNTAISECAPSASTTSTDAEPADTVCVVPICVDPSKKPTVPAASAGVTVAVSVSVDP